MLQAEFESPRDAAATWELCTIPHGLHSWTATSTRHARQSAAVTSNFAT